MSLTLFCITPPIRQKRENRVKCQKARPFWQHLEGAFTNCDILFGPLQDVELWQKVAQPTQFDLGLVCSNKWRQSRGFGLSAYLCLDALQCIKGPRLQIF